MIKIRNHRRVALLLVLAMLATMFVGVGTSGAADPIITFYTSPTTVVADGSYQLPSDITLKANEGYDVAASGATVSVYVTLQNSGDKEVEFKGNTFTKKFDGSNLSETGYCYVQASDLELKVPDDYDSNTITAKVSVIGVKGNTEFTIDSDIVTLAKIDSGKISANRDGKVKTVRIGSDQKGANIEVKEAGVSGFGDDSDGVANISYTIKTANVKYDKAECAVATDSTIPTTLTLDDPVIDFNDTAKKATVALSDADDAVREAIIFTPYFKILPGAEDGTEVKIDVAFNGSYLATLTVAKIGSYDTKISVVDGDKDTIYRGQKDMLENAAIKIKPAVDLDRENYFTITLPKGLYFNDDYSTPFRMVDNDNVVDFEGLKDDDQTAWFTINDIDSEDGEGLGSEETVKLYDLQLEADADAVVGDLNVTFGGDLEGTYKIGSIDNAFKVSTTPFALQSGKTTINGADIVITETAAGSMVDGETFDIELPDGMTFAEEPTVKVTTGDLEIGDVDTEYYWQNHDADTLIFNIDETSTDVSTITVSGVVYNAYNQPMLGDVVAKVGADYNQVSTKYLEKLTVGAIATNPTAVYVIGASTFTVNGVTQNVVTPSYIKDGRTYLAIRDIATGLGIDPVNVLWDAASSKVTMVKGDKIVQVTIGSTTMYVNGVAIAMNVAPEINNGRTMLPAAFIAQAFGANASWDGATQTVTIK